MHFRLEFFMEIYFHGRQCYGESSLIWVDIIMQYKLHKNINSNNDCHTLPDSANGCVTDSKVLCPFVSVRMRFLYAPHAANAFPVR